MKLDKGSLYAKDIRIKALEDLILQVGYDPSNVQVAELLIKKNNDDIAALRKQLKLPQSEHPQTKEILQDQTEKEEMMKLILKLTIRSKKWNFKWTSLSKRRKM